MSRWYRVFCRRDEQPDLDTLQAELVKLGVTEPIKVSGDDMGWTRVETSLLWIECFLASEQGIRAELNNWAAWLETREDIDRRFDLMEHVIQTQQLYTIQRQRITSGNDDWTIEEKLAQFFASYADGIYQVDGQGFIAANGTTLAPE